MSVTRVVLREQLKEVLLERILNGHYQPGDRLVELQIAQEFGTSQAPVREALRDLQALRFIDSEPFRGTRVRTITPEELAEIYPVRMALEALAARSAVERLGSDGTSELQKLYDLMYTAAERGDMHEQVHHDVEFHRVIVVASGNRILLDVWQSLRVEARTLVTVVETGIDARRLAEMHLPILEALGSGDPDRAENAIREHLIAFSNMLLKGPAA